MYNDISFGPDCGNGWALGPSQEQPQEGYVEPIMVKGSSLDTGTTIPVSFRHGNYNSRPASFHRYEADTTTASSAVAQLLPLHHLNALGGAAPVLPDRNVSSQLNQFTQVAPVVGLQHQHLKCESPASQTDLVIPTFTTEDRRKLETVVTRIKDRMGRALCVQCEVTVGPRKVHSREKRKASDSKCKASENPLCHRCHVGCNNINCFYCGAEVLLFPLARAARDILGRPACLSCCDELIRQGPPKSICSVCRLPSVWKLPHHTNGDDLSSPTCQRCAKNRKTYGSPLVCQSCQKVSAFNKGEEYLEQLDNCVLCFTCTLDYKRKKHQMKKMVAGKKVIEHEARLPPAEFMEELCMQQHFSEAMIPPSADTVLCPYELLQRRGTTDKHRDAKYWCNRLFKLRAENGSASNSLEELKKIVKSLEGEAKGQQDNATSQMSLTGIIKDCQKSNAEKRVKLRELKQKVEIRSKQQETDASTAPISVKNGKREEDVQKLTMLHKHQEKLGQKYQEIKENIAAKEETNSRKDQSLKEKADRINRLERKVKCLEEQLHKIRRHSTTDTGTLFPNSIP